MTSVVRRPQRFARSGAGAAVAILLAACAAADSGAVDTTAAGSTTSVAGSEPLFTPGDGTPNSRDPEGASVATAAGPTSASTTSEPATSAPSSTNTPATPATTTTASSAPAATTTAAPTTTSAATTTIPSDAAQPFVSPCPPTGAAVWEVRPASPLPAPDLPTGWRTESIGTSVQGRDLTALVRSVDAAAQTAVVIGGIHGNEPVSAPSVRAMVDADVPDDIELWLVPLLNPDGSAVGTRCNANGVDLNRNFSWDWRAATGGPAPFSEPESSAARSLIESVDPDVVVWVHQPLDYVSAIGPTPDRFEQAWSAGSGLPVRRDVTQHGGGESWTALEAGVPSILVEAAGWDATQEMVDEQVDGLDALLDVLTGA